MTEADVISFYGSKEAPEFSFPFNFGLTSRFAYNGPFDPDETNDPRNATSLRAFVDAYDAALPDFAAPNYAVANHDVRRLVTRLKNDTSLARVATAIFLTLRGTPTVYNGEEFSQKDGYVPPGRRQDPNCIRDYTSLRCRDPQRTPLQWDASSPNAGFSAAWAKTWLPVSADYVNVNVAAQLQDPDSYLALFSATTKLRKGSKCLHAGRYASLPVIATTPAAGGRGRPAAAAAPLADSVFAYVRFNGSMEAMVVVANLGTAEATLNLTAARVAQHAGLDGHVTATHAAVVLDSLQPSAPATNVTLGAVAMQASHLQVLRVTFASTGPPAAGDKDLDLKLIIGAGAGGAAVLLVLVLVVVRLRRGRGRTGGARSPGGLPYSASGDSSDAEARTSLLGGSDA